jgi:ribonuclease Z
MLIDCGEGTTLQLLRSGTPMAEVDHLFFTHLHADHSLGYGQFLLGGWAEGRRRLRAFGPTGARRLHDLLLRELYPDDVAYRLSLGRTPKGLTEDVEIEDMEGRGEVLAEAGLRVTRLPVVHSIATFAYRFDLPEGAVAFSGDTAYFEPLADFCRGVDVLVHDANMAPNRLRGAHSDRPGEVSWARLMENHTTAAEAGRIARLAGARALVLVHLLPGLDVEAAIEECRREYAGRLLVGEDLLCLEIRQ